MNTFRLAALMVAGGLFFALFSRYNLAAALLGALAGFAVEVFLRSGEPSQKRFWQFTTRELLTAMAVAAIGLAIIVWLWRL